MTAYTKHGKTSSAKRNSGRNPKLTDRDRRTLKKILARQHKTTAAKLTAELNSHLSNTVSAKTVRRELYKANIYELCNAATKIQASFRGHLTRKHMEGEKKGDESSSKEQEEELDIDLTDPDLNKAAAKIQASFRGHLSRKEGHGEGHPSN